MSSITQCGKQNVVHFVIIIKPLKISVCVRSVLKPIRFPEKRLHSVNSHWQFTSSSHWPGGGLISTLQHHWPGGFPSSIAGGDKASLCLFLLFNLVCKGPSKCVDVLYNLIVYSRKQFILFAISEINKCVLRTVDFKPKNCIVIVIILPIWRW